MKTLLFIAFVAASVGLIISLIVFYKLVFTKKEKIKYNTLVIDVNDPILE